MLQINIKNTYENVTVISIKLKLDNSITLSGQFQTENLNKFINWEHAEKDSIGRPFIDVFCSKKT